MKNVIYSEELNNVLISSKLIYDNSISKIKKDYSTWFKETVEKMQLREDKNYEARVDEKMQTVYYMELKIAYKIAKDLQDDKFVKKIEGVVNKRTLA